MAGNNASRAYESYRPGKKKSIRQIGRHVYVFFPSHEIMSHTCTRKFDVLCKKKFSAIIGKNFVSVHGASLVKYRARRDKNGKRRGACTETCTRRPVAVTETAIFIAHWTRHVPRVSRTKNKRESTRVLDTNRTLYPKSRNPCRPIAQRASSRNAAARTKR